MANKEYKDKIGGEVENYAPTPENPTEIANKQYVDDNAGDGKDLTLNSPNTASYVYFRENGSMTIYTFIKYNAATNFLEFGSNDSIGEVISARIDRGKGDWEFQDSIQILAPGRGVRFATPSFVGNGNTSTNKFELRVADTGVLELWSLNLNELNVKIWGGNDKGVTASRPAISTIGYQYFDTSLGLPIWWNGTNWINASGTVV